MMTVLAMAGLAIEIVHYEMSVWQKLKSKASENPARKYPDAMDHPRNSHYSTNLFRMITLGTSLMAAFCSYQR